MNRLYQVSFACILWGMSAAVSVGFAAVASGPADTSSGTAHTVSLEYTEVPFSLMNLGLGVTSQPRPFPKEPAFAGTTVRRGRLNFQFAGQPDLPFVWDTGKGRLYLDLNRNGDLTDDPSGVFSSALATAARVSYRYGVFTNIPLETQTGAVRQQRMVDLNLTDYGSRINAYAGVRSLWAGTLTLDGHEWQVGLIDTLQSRLDPVRSHLLLRPVDRRNEPFMVSDASLNAFPFPRRLFVESRLYGVECTAASSEEGVRFLLTLKEQPVETGELVIAGEYIQRVVLRDGLRLVVLDAPKESVRVPVGTYTDYQVRIGRDGSAAHPEPSGPAVRRPLVVDKTRTVTLTGGGPLTNTVALRRRGNYLVLDYRLIGAGGVSYQLGARDLKNPPQFGIYQDGRKIASGKFEFG